jgi:hypothetical protein
MGMGELGTFTNEGVSYIVATFALAAKRSAGFSLSPCYPSVGTGPIAPQQ